MKLFFSAQLIQRTAFCLLIVLFFSLGIFYARFTWEAFEHLAGVLNNSLNHADHYLLSLSRN
ncbi:MAG: hypothetical protein ABIN97_10970 [Ginsengibacter sp.]